MKRSANVVAIKKRTDAAEEHLKTFDELDFGVFSNQKWDRLSESHADDIVVTWPDGRETKGLAKHIEDLKAMFVYASDTKIKVHQVRDGRMDLCNGRDDGNILAPHADAGRQDNSAHGQIVQAYHDDDRPLEG